MLMNANKEGLELRVCSGFWNAWSLKILKTLSYFILTPIISMRNAQKSSTQWILPVLTLDQYPGMHLGRTPHLYCFSSSLSISHTISLKKTINFTFTVHKQTRFASPYKRFDGIRYLIKTHLLSLPFWCAINFKIYKTEIMKWSWWIKMHYRIWMCEIMEFNVCFQTKWELIVSTATELGRSQGSRMEK